jgi:hypothetical protein
MNGHKTPANAQSTSPNTLPVKNNKQEATATTQKNNTPGIATVPAKNNPLGASALPMKSNPIGTQQTDYYPRTMQQADYYPQGMQQTGYSPETTRQTGYYPPAIQQTGRYPISQYQADMFQPAVPERSIFQPIQQGQEIAPLEAPPRTSFMTSGRGVRDSVLTTTDFTQGFLQTQIGRHVKVEFLLGTNMLVDREGDLVRVGTDYIIIQETETDDYLLCDIYSIKFIRFYY